MNHIGRCFLYLALIGILFFIIGRIVPKDKFSYEKYPFRLLPIENDGKIYNKIGVRKWKDGFPDMSRILPAFMPSKRIPKGPSSEQIERMIQETCVAELVHIILSLLGFGCALIWKGLGGWVVSVLYMLGNLPYIIIQRYNRPKLVNLLQRLRVKEDMVQLLGQCYEEEKKWSKTMSF